MAENTNTERANFEAWAAKIGWADAGFAQHMAWSAWQARASLPLPAAGQEPVDYAPMLDDDGREMVVNSHHYTADNIRALVAEYKALEANAPGSWLKHHNTDHCTRAGVLWRILSALADEVPLAAPQPAVAAGWVMVPVEPTEPMKLAAKAADMDHSSYRDWVVSEWPEFLRIWTAMLKAAPLPPAPSTEGESNG